MVCEQLAGAGHLVRAAVRSAHALPAACVAEREIVGDIDGNTDWQRALHGVEAVLHAAARVHMLRDAPANAALYEQTNASGTRWLAECAARAGVRRFVFLSSVKVNGEQTFDRPFTAQDVPAPGDAYGDSKRLAENYLRAIANESKLQVAVVRPPLVYGPGVRANFLRMMRWVHAERPLPFGSIRNCRSLVNVWNLADLLRVLLERDDPASRTWMVSDGDDVSTPELIGRIAESMQRRTRLVRMPIGLLTFAAGLLGAREQMRRLCGSLVVDSMPARAELGWVPPVSMDEGLRRTARWFESSEVLR